MTPGSRWHAWAWMITLWLSACDEVPPDLVPNHDVAAIEHASLRPLSPPPEADPALVGLGADLFSEPRLSHDGTVSCASCHDLAHGGDDGRRSAVGIGGALGPINTPTVFNAALNFRQFWDGRAETLEEQIDGPTQSPLEMGSSWDAILAFLSGDAAYRTRFENLFADGVTAPNVRSAIAAFERTLITVDAPFDRYLAGDESALSESAREGHRLFEELGCASCHQGANIGGNMFQRFGVMGDYFGDRGGLTPADLGRYAVTHREEDRHVFRVPSLRNVALTAPYFHDGSATTLEEAVRVMARYQLGRHVASEEVAALVAFLTSLTGRVEGLDLEPSP